MLTLALGIGATTAIFSLIHSVMLKSVPVIDPSSLYRVGDGNECCMEGGFQDNWGMYTYQLYQRFKEAAPEFEQLAAFQAGGSQFSVRRSGTDRQAKPLRGEFVTGNYFMTFGIQAFAGRTLTPADDQPSASPTALLSYRAWQQEYGAEIRLVLRGAFLQVLLGLLIGIPASIGCSRLIATQLYQVQGWDPLVLGGSIMRLESALFSPASSRRKGQPPSIR